MDLDYKQIYMAQEEVEKEKEGEGEERKKTTFN